ncbi:hypothetical protein [Nocardiopsis sp. YSL2]|uniref:hypothetical protein n=1 Tax=Nocardiopsis sp. YSL2 TaxID=2939492 RepID=UPI0026F4201D|nr:hypothetical protein [Nocardiopsis sp. YSL2]
MADVSAVRSVLADRLATITGLRVQEYTEGSVSPPTATLLVGLGPDTSMSRPAIDYDKSYRGAAMLNFLVKVAVSATLSDVSQRELDAYLAKDGPKSIKAAIEADSEPLEVDDELVADYALVPAVTHYGFIQWGGVDYLGADFHVGVLTR